MASRPTITTMTPSALILTIACSILLLIPGCRGSFSSRPEEKVIEYPDSGMLAAFADINADTKTDVFLIDKSLKSFTIMAHKDQDTFEAPILYFSQRCYMDEEIVSLIPADFRGETYVDVAVISRNPDSGDAYNIRVSRGYGPQKELDCSHLNQTANYTSSVQPLLLDYNGDMIADLLIENKNKDKEPIRTILLGPYNERGFSSSITPFDVHDSIADPHANHFVDFNGDSVADIIIQTDKNFEYWYSRPGSSFGDLSRKASVTVPIPTSIDGRHITEYGQSVFIDIDGDSHQEHLLPVNLKYEGGDVRAAILMLQQGSYSFTLIAGNFTPSNETQYLSLREEHYKSDPSLTGITFPRAMRQGDVNGDGYPDLVSLMHSKDSPETGIIITLENVPAADGHGHSSRTFTFMSKAAVQDPLIAAFMDLTENGKLDLMYSSKARIGGSDVVRMGGIMNVVAFETYFLKVMVASGRCPSIGCTNDEYNKKDIVDYGSNLPGAYVTYSLQDVNGEKKRCGAGQMTSAAHFALQTPYLVLGLGEYANYVDVIKITLPFDESPKREREEEQIVPDAQIVIVPRDKDPRRWTVKMWLNINGNQIKHTGYTLYLIFCILLIIIIALHKKEVMEDADENKRFKQNWLDSR